MDLTLIQALSGLGMFLFGMLYMELALKEAAGSKFKSWIKNSTATISKSLLTGIGATAMLQSSSVVTLITLSFVSASLISLQSGIAIIFGSNIGTTVTSWIVAILGFKVKIDLFAIPMVGAGGLLLVFSSSHKKLAAYAKMLIGFGLLFLGLDIMKTAIESTATGIDLSLFSKWPLLTFIGIGFILTALIQSSSAATAIILSALYAQILNFEQSAAMIIGTNIGTTTTALLGSIGGIPDKKRAAVAHLVFNMITALIAFVLLSQLSNFLLVTLELQNNLTLALALFHTIFNLLGVIILTPFIPFFAQSLEKLFKHKQIEPTRYLHLVDTKVPETAFVALKNEMNNLFIKTIKFGFLLTNIKPHNIINGKNRNVTDIVESNQETIEFDYTKTYDNIKEIEFRIVEFINKLSQQELTSEQNQTIDTILQTVRHSVYAAKILKDVKENIDEFAQSDNLTIQNIYKDIRKNIVFTFIIFINYMNKYWSAKESKKKFNIAHEENKQIITKASRSLSERGVYEKTVISLLNTNRSVFIASNSLYKASRSLNQEFELDEDDI